MKTFMIFIMVLFLSMGSFAQQRDDRIVVDKSDLPPDLLKQIEADKLQETTKTEIEEYGEYVSIGKEIGAAISEGLGAVVDEAEHFSETNVGLFVMILIAWAILGEQFLALLIGVPIYFIGLFIMVRYYKYNFSNHKMVKQQTGWWIFGKREFEMVESGYVDSDAAAVIAGILYFVWTVVLFIVVF